MTVPNNTSTFDGMFQEAAPDQYQPNSYQPQSLEQNPYNGAQDMIPPTEEIDPLNLVPQQPVNNNDLTRYQYQQSRADKLAKENEELQRKVAEYDAMVRTQSNQQPVQTPPPQEEEVFPEFNIPAPVQPYNFSWNDAYNDPASDSARFLAEKEAYRDKLIQYNTIKTNYIEEKSKDRVKELEQKIQLTSKQMQERYEMEQQVNTIAKEVQTKFNVSREVADDFIKTMGDNSIYNMDNMWKFYLSQRQPQGYQQPMQQMQGQMNGFIQKQPSPLFNQYQRAGSIPNTMNVSAVQETGGMQGSLRDQLLQQIQQSKKNNMFG